MLQHVTLNKIILSLKTITSLNSKTYYKAQNVIWSAVLWQVKGRKKKSTWKFRACVLVNYCKYGLSNCLHQTASFNQKFALKKTKVPWSICNFMSGCNVFALHVVDYVHLSVTSNVAPRLWRILFHFTVYLYVSRTTIFFKLSNSTM